MRRERAPESAGFVVPLVVMAGVVTAILALAFLGRSADVGRAADWSRDHVVARLLAESVAEELFVQLSEAANLPGDPTWASLRTLNPGPAFRPVPLAALKPDVTRTEIEAVRKRTGMIATLVPGPGAPMVEVVSAARVSNDPAESSGRVRIECGVSLAGRGGTVTERVRLERSFLVSRATLPRIGAGGSALYIGTTDRASLPNFCPPGSPLGPPAIVAAAPAACTRTDGAYRTLLELMSQPDGFASASTGALRAGARAAHAVSPEVVAARAHFVVDSRAELESFLASRLSAREPLPVNGVIFHTSSEPLRLSFGGPNGPGPFSGTAMIVSSGPITVGEVRLQDRNRDSLTLVSSSSLLVTGRSVEASLVATGPNCDGVVLATRTRILGPVLTSRFPRGAGLSGMELGQCQFGANASRECAGRDEGTPRSYAGTVALFSPFPVRLEHDRE